MSFFFKDPITFSKRPEGTDEFSRKLVAYDGSGFGWVVTPDLSGTGITLQPNPTFYRDFATFKTLNHGEGPNITFTRGSSATYFDSTGVLRMAGNNEPRFDHDPATGASRGLLIEEARTNSIRNSQAGGAVTGSPGTMPTNWSHASPFHGLSREIVATGTANGFAYIDIRISGTADTTGGLGIFFEGVTTAASGQTWTSSAYVALVAGAIPSLVRIGIEEGVGTTRNSATFVNMTLSGSLQRFSVTRTFTEATTNNARPFIDYNYSSGTAVDFTLRIAAPQLEQGAFPTSYIPTTTAAATRSADSAVVTPISSFYNQSEGTLFAEATLRGITSGSFPRVVQFDEASSSDNRFNILCASTPAASAEYRTSGVGQLNTTETAITLGTVFRTIAAVATNNGRVATNGALAGSDDTSLTMNSANTRMRIGTEAGGSFFTGHIRKIAYWPKRLSNTFLQQQTQ